MLLNYLYEQGSDIIFIFFQYLEQKKHDAAYEAWRNATSLKATHAVAWSNMVIMLDSIGRRELAEDVGREALTHLPNEAGLHFNLANTLGKLKQFSQAERHFLKATQLDTQNAKYHANLGALNIFFYFEPNA